VKHRLLNGQSNAAKTLDFSNNGIINRLDYVRKNNCLSPQVKRDQEKLNNKI